MEQNKILRAIHKPKADEFIPYHCSDQCFWYPTIGRHCKLFDKTLKNEGPALLRCGKCVVYEE